MKTKTANLFISTLILLSFFSCKKNYSCFCKLPYGGAPGGFYQNLTIHYQQNETKSDAKKKCQQKEASLNNLTTSNNPNWTDTDSTYSCYVK